MGSHLSTIDMLDIQDLAAQNINTEQLIGGISESELIGFSEVFDELYSENFASAFEEGEE